MTTESLSEKRRRAGLKGAQSRWGARNAAPTSANADDGLVCGTAAELREMAEALTTRSTARLDTARGISASRVAAYKRRHPDATASDLAGRVICEAVPTEPGRGTPKLRLVNQDSDEAELWLYDVIDSWGGYWGISAAEVVEQLAEITASRVVVHINSPGGEVWEAVAIKRAIADHPSDVTVKIDSLAASAATIVAMAGDTIAIDSAAMMMIHDASGFAYGNAADMLQMAGLLDKVSDVIAGVYTARAGGDPATWRARMLAESWYTATEAIDVGLADELIDPPASDDEPVAVSDRPFLLSALVASATPQPEPPAALPFLRAVKEAATR